MLSSLLQAEVESMSFLMEIAAVLIRKFLSNVFKAFFSFGELNEGRPKMPYVGLYQGEGQPMALDFFKGKCHFCKDEYFD
jgi:hypothetical protein